MPAGLGRMPLLRFWLYTALGSGLWNTLLIGAGRLLGDNWRDVQGILGPLGPIVYGVLLLVLFAFIARRMWQRRKVAPGPGAE